MLFLSGVDGPNVRGAAAMRSDLGLILTPNSNRAPDAPAAYPFWAADNGCFSKADAFDLAGYLRWLGGLPARDRCLFAVAPDVVGDAAATWARSRDVLPRIRALGYPAALVAQDGIEAMGVPWGAFDVLFIGGTDPWKLSERAYGVMREAAGRGVPVHAGRVNSRIRLRAMAAAGCASADGTLLKRERKYLPRLVRWLDELAARPSLWAGPMA